MAWRKKKKGKRYCIPLSAILRNEWEQLNRGGLCVGGVLLVLAAVLCRIAIGSPYYTRHLLRMPYFMPPTVVLYAVGLLLYFLLGALFGGLCITRSAALMRARFKGLTLLVPTALFRLLWYPLFFGACAPALALISLLLSVFCCLCACRLFRGNTHIAVMLLLIELVWTLLLTAVTLAVLILN